MGGGGQKGRAEQGRGKWGGDRGERRPRESWGDEVRYERWMGSRPRVYGLRNGAGLGDERGDWGERCEAAGRRGEHGAKRQAAQGNWQRTEMKQVA